MAELQTSPNNIPAPQRTFGQIGILIFTAIIIFALAPFTVASIVGITNSTAETREAAAQLLEVSGAAYRTAIEGWLSERQSDLDTISVDPTFVQQVLLIKANPQNSLVQANILDRFTPISGTDQPFAEIYLLDEVGNLIFGTQPSNIGTLHSSRPYHRYGLLGPHITEPILDLATNEFFIAISVPVINVNLETEAVLVGQFSVEVLIGQITISDQAIGEEGEVYLVSPYQRPLSSLRYPFGEDELNSQIIKMALVSPDLKTETATYPNYANMDVIGNYQHIQDTNILLISEIPTSEAYADITTQIRFNAFLGIALVILAGFTSSLLYRRINTPLAKMTQHAQALSNGDCQAAFTYDRGDEMGTLVAA